MSDKPKWRRKAKRKGLFDVLPNSVLALIASHMDVQTQAAFSMTCKKARSLIELEKQTENHIKLDALPTEVLTSITAYLRIKDLGSLAQVNKRFKEVVKADFTWYKTARNCLVTNGRNTGFLEHTAPFPIWSSNEKVRVSHNWATGHYFESHLAVQNIRYMPRIQLQRSYLWVSWGKHIWSHPRKKDGTIGQTTNKVMKGHTDDVSKFVVKDGWIVSGGRDRALFGWYADSGEFMFAKRYCHGSEISAVDIIRNSGLVMTGSKDKTVKIWTLDPYRNSDGSGESADERPSYERGRAFPKAIDTLNLRDRVWSLAADPCGKHVVVGTAGLQGIPSLHVIDLDNVQNDQWLELGQGLKKGAGMLDVQWLTPNCFLSCGYDACTRLWDLRVASCVRTWEEPYNEAIYSIATDGNMTMICGTARHGLARLWDMRHSSPVQQFYVKHPFQGQSSPVYSVAFDQRHMYAALDQSVNMLSFGLYKRHGHRRNSMM